MPNDSLTALLTRAPPASPPAPTTTPSLETLIAHTKSYRWADVLSESSHLLTSDEPPAAHHASLIHTHRALALLQTRQTQRASDALAAHPAHPEHHPPSLRALLALDLRVRAADYAALPETCRLLTAPLAASDESSEQTHRGDAQRVALNSALSGYALRAGKEALAIDCARAVCALRKDAHSAFALCRLLLHVHDLEEAAVALHHARVYGAAEGRLAAHRAMIHSADGEFQLALEEYDRAIAMAEDPEGGDVGERGERAKGSWWVYAMNNSAICLLHLGRLHDAVERLEKALTEMPERALCEGLVFNLATLYQLAFPDTVVEKKRVLRKVAERYGRQGFDLEGVGL